MKREKPYDSHLKSRLLKVWSEPGHLFSDLSVRYSSIRNQKHLSRLITSVLRFCFRKICPVYQQFLFTVDARLFYVSRLIEIRQFTRILLHFSCMTIIARAFFCVWTLFSEPPLPRSRLLGRHLFSEEWQTPHRWPTV